MALAEAEALCEKFRKNFQSDILVIRLNGYYHLPYDRYDARDIVSRICLETVKNRKPEAFEDGSGNRNLMLIHESDAAYFISGITLSPSHDYPVYHVSSGCIIQEEQLWATARSVFEKRASSDIRKSAASEETAASQIYTDADILLDIGRFEKEFGINHLASLEKNVDDTIRRIIKHKERFLDLEDEKKSLRERFLEKTIWFFKALLPFAENLACFFLVYFAHNLAENSRYFSRIDLYLLYVIMFAVFYGENQAAFSAFFSSAGMLLYQMQSEPGKNALLDYSTYVWIAQLFIVGLTVGYLKDRLTAQKDEALDDHEYMTEQITDIREINGSNSRVKDVLEKQLINHNDSIGKIYSITSSLDAHHSVDVLFCATEVFRTIMGSPDISVYIVTEDSLYARLFTATSERAKGFSQSFLYKKTGEMYEAFRERKPYINKRLDEHYPSMAAAVYEGEEIRFIVMIWSLTWDKMTLGQANLMMVVCMLTQNAVIRARHYYNAIRHTQHLEDTTILLQAPFRRLLDMCDNAAEKRLTVFSVLHLKLPGESAKATGVLASNVLRANDYIGLGKDGEIYVIISNTSETGIQKVIERLAEIGMYAELADHEQI